MRLPEPLIPGKLIKRYKRFLADIELENDQIVTAHCPNPGGMFGLNEPGSPVLLSKSDNPKRKLPFTWELIKVNKTWVVVNTVRANQIVHEALAQGSIPELSGYSEIKREAVWTAGCRFDFLLKNGGEPCFVEVKNVTLAENDVALFPDAVTNRGTKHVNELISVVAQGMRGVVLFLVNREDCRRFKPAETIDAVFADTLAKAKERGVEILVYRTQISPPEIFIDCALNFEV